jgi:GT2 family glycosyltransferase
VQKKKVSIIIVNLNGERFLDALFESLKKTTYDNYEIIFVDNGSTDKSADIVKKYPYVNFLALGKNTGFTGGNNYGLQHATGDYILLLNNDVIVYPDWLDKLVDAAEADQNIMVAGGVIILMHLFGRMDFSALKKILRKPIDAHMISGSCLLIKREMIEKMGCLLHEEYFAYWEETELCWRTNMMGYKVVWINDCYYYHFSGGFSNIRETDKKKIRENLKRFDVNYYYYRNEMMFYLRNYSFFRMICSLPKPFIRAVYFLIVKRNTFIITSYLKGLKWILTHFPKLWRERQAIQKTRKIPDKVIVKRMKEKNRYAKEVMDYMKSVEAKLVSEKGKEALNTVPSVEEVRKLKNV